MPVLSTGDGDRECTEVVFLNSRCLSPRSIVVMNIQTCKHLMIRRVTRALLTHTCLPHKP